MTPPTKGGVVLLVVQARDWPPEVLLRAADLARHLEAELQLLCLVSGRGQSRPPVWRTVQDLEGWCIQTLKAPLPERRISVAFGKLLPAATAAALRLGASLLVVPPSLKSWAPVLARTAQVPVFVARPPSPGATVLAATDLGDDDAPVLRYGAALSRRLEEPVVFVHNVRPLLEAVTAECYPMLAEVFPSAENVATRCRTLDRLARDLSADGRAVVEVRRTPADAVLDTARVFHADVIVVGTHERTWFDRLLHPSTAKDLALHALQSVLVLPLPAAHPA